MAGLIGYVLRLPSNEITRGCNSIPLLQTAMIAEATVVPAPYAGICRCRRELHIRQTLKPFAITTHLEEAQAKELFAQKPPRWKSREWDGRSRL